MPAISKTRPKFLNLAQIKLPLPGIVSIFHRVSGAGLFLMLPLILWVFTSSVGTQAEFATFKAVVSVPVVKLFLLLLVAGYIYHFCAGIRFLLLDLHKGIDLPTARMSSKLVLAAAIILTLIIGAKLW